MILKSFTHITTHCNVKRRTTISRMGYQLD